MAIHPKKRDRLAMTSSPVATTNKMSLPPLAKATADECEDEYQRALSFLRDFHSRRVAAALHSTSLDAILEADGFDEALAGDFSLALSVGPGGAYEEKEDGFRTKREGRDDLFPPAERSAGLGGMRRTGGLGGLSGMKKAATSKCLLDLDSSPSASHDALPRCRTTPSLRTAERRESDFFLGYGYDEEEEEEDIPATKRRRGLLCR